MKLLLIEDSEPSATTLRDALKARGIALHLVLEDSYIDAIDRACSALRQVQSEKEVFDALVLDIDFKDHKFGGVKIFVEIQKRFLRGKFRHLFIWTKHKNPSRLGTAIESEVVDIIRDLSGMKPSNVFGKGASEAQKIADRLIELHKERQIIVAYFGHWRFGGLDLSSLDMAPLSTPQLRLIYNGICEGLRGDHEELGEGAETGRANGQFGWLPLIEKLKAELTRRGEAV